MNAFVGLPAPYTSKARSKSFQRIQNISKLPPFTENMLKKIDVNELWCTKILKRLPYPLA